MFKKWLKYSSLTVLILTLISLILSIWQPTLQSFRIVFGLVYLLFLPGFIWSWVFWKRGEIDFIERLILSLALSIAIVPLVVFFLNKVGLRINLLNSFLEIFGIIVLGSLFIFFEVKGIFIKIKSVLKRNA